MDTKPDTDSTGDGDGIGNNTPSWSSDTNWTVVNGSLQTSVTLESSDTVINEEENIEKVDLTGRSQHLILKPPSPDSGPCEIKLCFGQKYEIRQVYVRSSARVYEIHYAPSLKATDEYLCTIRCTTAVRDGDTLQVSNVTSEANSCTSEDDWVDVKVPEKPNNINDIQDLYEATAEINDADPCTSVTIRLLSLQNKGCVHVDEVYVYADLVDSTDDMENQTDQIGSSTGSSALMAMLVPTLMQISKSSAHEKKLKNVTEEIQSVASTNQQNVKLDHDPRADDPDMNRREVKTDLPYSRIEGLLEQLISRVSKVEDFCSRFESNMLKPINSIEARLQQVEEQLKILSNDSQLPPSTRISAPSFSCDESDSSSVYEDSSRRTPSGVLESEQRDLHSTDLSKLSSDLPFVESIPHFLPGLVITAPEFSCGEDDEDDDDDDKSTMEAPSPEKPERPLSIDDALAAALSGFLSTSANSSEAALGCTSKATETNEASAQTLTHIGHEFTVKENDHDNEKEPSRFTQILTVTAPEFTMEGGGDEKHAVEIGNEKKSGSQSDEVENFGISVSGTENIQMYVSCAKDPYWAAALYPEGFAENDNCQINEEPESSVENTEYVVSTDNNILLNLTESSSASVVDLNFPVLDVKFASHESSVTESPLETLLRDVADITTQTTRIQDVYEKAENPLTANDILLLDFEDNSKHVSLNLGVGLHDPSSSSNQEISASLI